MSIVPPHFHEQLGPFWSELGLPPTFAQELISGSDDWAFVIKLHALLEAVLTSTLIDALARPELSAPLSQLEMSGSTTGKIAFAESLGLLDSSDRRFIRKFSELRNGLVHNVTRVSFSLVSHVSAMSTEQLDSFCESFAPYVFGLTREDSTTYPRTLLRSFIKDNLRDVIAFTALSLCHALYLKKRVARSTHSLSEAATSLFRSVIHEPGA